MAKESDRLIAELTLEQMLMKGTARLRFGPAFVVFVVACREGERGGQHGNTGGVVAMCGIKSLYAGHATYIHSSFECIVRLSDEKLVILSQSECAKRHACQSQYHTISFE